MDAADIPNRRRRDLLELCIGYALILAVLWTPRPYQRLLYCVAVIFLVAVLWKSFDGWAAMGLRIANLGRSIWVVGVALAIAATAVFVAWRMHTFQSNGGLLPLVRRYWGYAIWAFAQQVLLQDFFLSRLLRLMRRPGSAALMAAAIFSLAHLPSPILTVVTFVWGLAASLLFLHYRNLYPLALAHAIFGITIAITVPGPVIRNMRVGLGYLTYASNHHGYHRSK
jgi:Type II CAAX prenyl endopeptidase Rce1-like